jgi:trimeric autotransporter adhesin
MNSSLNHIYRVVWNASLGLWQVASEVACSGGKTQSEQRKTRRLKVGAAAVAGAFAGLASMAIPNVAFAQLPTGGQVVAGQASIVQNGNALNINQTTDRAAIDWQTFNVGQGNKVNFNQPSASSIALNRVLGSDVSVIQGAINANGQVFLVNQNGILFTPTAQVNVGGIVASTQNISTADFMAGKYTFSGNSTGTVENQGSITTATGGTVALIAAKIINTGTITAPQGTVGLAAGNTVTLDLGGPVKIQVTQGALNTAIEQGGGIVADGGQIYLTAKAAGNLAASVINHTGITRARTLAGNQKGEIILLADMEVGTTTVAGTLDASSPNGGDGGFIETSAANVKIQDGVNITTQSAQGKNGQWLIDPHDFTIAATGGDITGAALGTALANNSVTIQTLASSVSCTGATCGTGNANGNGDIFVNDAINAGTSTNTLTLQAHRDINVNNTVTVGGLNLTAVRNVNVNDVVTVNNSLAVNYGANADFTPNTTVRPTDNGALNMKMDSTGFVGKINLGASANSVRINDSAHTIIRDRAGLEAINSGLTGNYVLANDVSLGGTEWAVLGNSASVAAGGFFAGHMEGLGHKVSQLSITSAASSRNTGLFGLVADAALSNIGVAGTISFTDVNTGSYFTGGLVGLASGSSTSSGSVLRNVFANVDVTVTFTNPGGTASTQTTAGGLIGSVSRLSLLNNAYANGNVSNTGAGSSVTTGGLVGFAQGSSTGIIMSNVYATTGNVSSTSSSTVANVNTGGLIGNAAGSLTLTNAYATGSVTSSGAAASKNLGGLIGTLSSATSVVNVQQVFASGNVSNSDGASIRQGGLVGNVANSGAGVKTLSSAYWDPTSTGQTLAVASNAQQQPTLTNVETAAIGTAGTLFPNLDSNIWSFVNGTPMLKLFQQAAPMVMPIFIRLDCGLCESIYGETPQFSFKAFNAASGGTEVSDAMLAGTALYSLTSGGVAAGTELGRLTDAGTYSVTYTSGLTGASMYQLSAGAATNFTIKPKLLTVAIQAALGGPLSKVYDGSQNIALAANNFAISGFVDQQGVGASVSGVTSGTFNNANVAQANTITAELAQNSIVLPSTAKASNYTLPTTASGAGTITPKALTITTNDFVSSATANTAIASTNGLVGDQSVSAVNLDGKNLSVAFGQDTLSSNYATTVVVPGASGADLAVNRDLTLASGLNLTLRADKNIVVNKVIDATTGTGGKVSLEFGQGTVAAGNTAEYVMNLVDTTFNGKINLLKGQNFATKQGSDGQVLNYTVITELGAEGSTTGTDLQGINGGVNFANLAGRYVLGGDIDATATAQWDGGFGFMPIIGRPLRGAVFTPFSGTFDGLGHSVSNLTINRGSRDFNGLFGQSTGHIRHVGLLGGNVDGLSTTGALVGQQSGGSIRHVYSTASVFGAQDVGGLVGRLQNSGSVRHVRSSGAVGGIGSNVGGLIGRVTSESTVSNSHASGNVFAINSLNVGGLVGIATLNSILTDVSASGQVTGDGFTGGLIGRLNNSILSRAFASGAVNGPEVSSGSTNGYGGLVGNAGISTISDVFATGAVNAGALQQVGGLIGSMSAGSLTNGYATGAVMGMTDVGGLVGTASNSSTLSNSFWNTLATGRETAVGAGELSATSMGNAGKTTAQLQNAFTFIDAGWNFDTVWGKSITGANGGNMQLRSFTNDNFDDYVRVADASKVYGSANNTITGAAVSGVGAANVTASFGSAVGELSDAGEYLYSTENVLNVTNKVAGRTTFVDRAGKLTITPKALTVALQAAMNNPLSKVYDGNETIALGSGNFALSGFVGSQGVGATLGGVTSGTFNSKNVLQATTVSADIAKATLSGTAEGFKASNYSLPTTPVTAAGTISAKGIAVTGLAAQNKTYDGNRAAVVTGTAVVDTTGVIQGDTVSVTGTVTGGLFADKDAGTDKAVSVSGLSLSGTDASNYAIAPANLKANIAQKALTIAGTSVANKDYDGNTNATVTVGTITGVVEGETLGSTTATGQFAGKDVVRNQQGAATAQNVTVAYTLASGENPAHKASNYTLASETKTATINPKALTIAGSQAANKTYDGNTAATVSAGTLSGLVQGETLGATTATGQFADKNAGTGKNVTVAYTLVDGVGSITAGAPTFDGSGNVIVTAPMVVPGAKASNYSLAGETLKADIAQKQVSITEFAASNKTYDGNTTATISNAGKLNGVLEGDAAKVALTNTGATFDTKDAGTAKTVTLNGKALSGDEAKNYVLASDAVTAKADIAQKQLTVTGFAAGNKTYDGNTTATISNAGSLTGVVLSDAGKVALNNTGATFDTKDAGTAKTVTLNGKTLTGDEAKNYVLASDAVTATADIAQKQLTIAEFAAANKVYDGNTTAMISNAGKLVGVVEGDTGKVALGNTGATFDTKNAGTGKTVTLNGANITGTEAKNYLLATDAVTTKADVAKKEITLAGFDAANKVYDGNTVAQIVSSGSLTGVVTNDTVMVGNSGATFDTKNAGTGKTVTLNGVALSGTDAGNYSIASTATDTADIAQKQLTVTGFAAGNKTYDGNTAATISNAGTLNGVVLSDAGKVALNNTGATFDTKDAGTAKTVTLNGKTLTGDEAKNYVLADAPVTAQANIDRRALSIAGSVVANKTYDGGTAATVTAGTLSGLVGGETLGATTATGQFADKNAGTGKNVTVAYTLVDGVGSITAGAPTFDGSGNVIATAPMVVPGAKASNYSLAGETLKADIAQKQVSITEFAASNKTYDGNTTATISNAGKLNGVLEGDAAKVALTNTGATFDTKDAGTAKTVTLNGKALSGDEAKNYVLASDAVTAKADITKKAITLVGFDAANKVYDGNTTAQIVNSGSLTGVVQNDTVMVSNSGATFDTKNAGTGKTVTLNGVELSGTDAGNYSIANTATDTANITQKQLTIAEFAAANKVYDGNTTATIANAGKLVGVVEGDTGKVALGNTGATFDTKNAGTGKTVTLNGANITGTEAANYTLALTAVTAKADIAKKEITLAGFDAANKVYDGNTTAQIVSSGSLTGVVQNDTVMVSNNGATFDNKNAGTGKTVTLNGVALSGSDAGNYSIASTATDTADITKKAITLAGFDAANKVYDGNTTAQVVNSGSLTGVVTNDTVMVSNNGATFDTKNAGAGKTVTLNGVELSGTDAANYSIASTATDTADITKKAITLTGFDAANKVYDGNTVAQIVSSGSLTGVVEKDAVTVSNSGATFDNRNAGNGKTVTLNGVALSGTDAGNYSIASTATDTADITKRGGVVLTAQDKEKQLGAADPALTFEVTGLVQGDSLTGSLSRVAGETPGFYAINRGTVDNPNYEISQFNPGQLQINQSLPQETIATVNTLSSPDLRPSLGERPPLGQGGAPESQAQSTPFLVTPAQANVGGPAQVVVIEGGINLNFAGGSENQGN